MSRQGAHMVRLYQVLKIYRAVSWLSKYIVVVTPVILPSLRRHQLGQITSKMFVSSSPFIYLRGIIAGDKRSPQS